VYSNIPDLSVAQKAHRPNRTYKDSLDSLIEGEVEREDRFSQDVYLRAEELQ